MQLPEESAKRFQDIYEREIGEKITIGEAREMATRLVTLYRALAKPLLRQGNIRTNFPGE